MQHNSKKQSTVGKPIASEIPSIPRARKSGDSSRGSGRTKDVVAPKVKKATARQLDRFQKLVITGQQMRDGDSNFSQDADQIRKRFLPMESDFHDALLGPIVVAPKVMRGGLELSWRNFPIAYGQRIASVLPEKLIFDFQSKQEIAEVLFKKRVPETQQPLLPRSANVLFGPGSTVFHCAIAVARRLRDALVDETAHGESFLGEFHTDMFDVARLLAPICVHVNSPRVIFAGFDVTRRGPIEEDVPFRPPQKERTVHTLVIGVSDVDSEGRLYSRIQSHGPAVEECLKEPASQIIIVATAEKLDRNPTGIPVTFDKGSRIVYIVTNRPPKVKKIPGIDKIFWPE